MGMFDGLLADDTTKDQSGMTQADRRQPVYDALIKAGLLGVAAGGDIMPQQRAQLLAQAGGALGDIGQNRLQYEQAAAQSALRRQQIKSNQSKLDNAAKLQAYAQKPEFQSYIDTLKPVEKLAIQATIDAGDVDAFVKATGQVGGGAHKDLLDQIKMANLAMGQERLKLQEEKAAKKEAEGQAMSPGRAWTIINNNANKPLDDPFWASPEYKAAHTLLTNPHSIKDANDTLQNYSGFDLSYLPDPTFNPTGRPPQPKSVTPVPGQAPKALTNQELEGVGKHVTTLTTMNDIDSAIAKNPDMKLGNVVAGLASNVAPELVSAQLNKIDPAGTETRSNIANIRSMVILDRSGKAVTVHEMKQLADFIPTIFDDGPAVQRKLETLRKKVNIETKLYYDNLKAKNAAIPPDLADHVRKIGKGGMTIPQKSIELLEGDPSKEAISEFNTQYGAGAAERVLGR